MKDSKEEKEKVLLVGDSRSICGLAVCLQKAGHPVLLKTRDRELTAGRIDRYRDEISEWDRKTAGREEAFYSDIRIVEDWNAVTPAGLSIVITGEKPEEKQKVLSRLEEILPRDAAIAINTESIPLCEIQQNALNPRRILGMNWVDPVYNTLFLEIICNSAADERLADSLRDLAYGHWGKDPYVIRGELGIRMPLIGALVREAFFLVENGYATTEDIDRACRNDAGYYLPFAGNLRYMDLMGTYAYGMVMKDLNPELSTGMELPRDFLDLVNRGDTGMEAGKGFYPYPGKEAEKWDELMRKFSFEIKELFDRYPFETVPGEAALSFKG